MEVCLGQFATETNWSYNYLHSTTLLSKARGMGSIYLVSAYKSRMQLKAKYRNAENSTTGLPSSQSNAVYSIAFRLYIL